MGNPFLQMQGEHWASYLELFKIRLLSNSSDLYYRAEDVERVLRLGQHVVRSPSIGRMGQWEEKNTLNSISAVQEGLLIGIKSIQKDTAEDIVRDLAKWSEENGCIIQYRGDRPDASSFSNLIERAKKLIKPT